MRREQRQMVERKARRYSPSGAPVANFASDAGSRCWWPCDTCRAIQPMLHDGNFAVALEGVPGLWTSSGFAKYGRLVARAQRLREGSA